MKPSRLVFAATCVVLAFAIPGNSCGPFFPEAVFVQNSMPDGPYAAYAKGEIGVPQPGYRVQDLVVAYDWLNGHGLSEGEQQQAVVLNHLQTTRGDEDPTKLPGFAAWLDAHNDFFVPQSAKSNAPQDKTAQTTGDGADNPDRPVPGQSYQSFVNCLDPAFATAAATLNARKAAHPDDPASLTDWVQGQDAVFANCNGSSDTMPADAPSNAPAWLQQDRAYQQAAAKFYQTDYDGAIARLKTITADASSPWHPIALLVEARAMIRRATIGQITELPAAIEAPNAPYSADRAKAEEQYAELLKQKLPERLTQARVALKAIVADSSMQPYHADAGRLLDFVNLRLDPAAQANLLAARVTAPDRPQTPGVFQQALIDLRYYLYSPYANQATGPMTQSPSANTPLFGWMQAMRTPAPVQKTDWDSSEPDPAKAQQQRELAATKALAQWHTSHAAPWLLAAMVNTDPGDVAAPELIQAAATVPQASPEWTAATYHRLRLMPDAAAMRNDLAAIEPSLLHVPQRSTINLFEFLNQRTAPTLAGFLHSAASLPAGVTTMDSGLPDEPATTTDTTNLCGVKGSQATTLLFNPDAATILNTRMPLTLLAEAAENKSLPPNLSFQIAQSTWTRAILLNQPDVAKRMAPILTGCYPAWKQWLDDYDNAATAGDRHVAGLLALMRFPSNAPLVSDGMERNDGFAGYSVYRDNWWSESTDAKSATSDNPGGTQVTFFGTQQATRAALPDPPFLTAADRTAADREIAALRSTPCSSDYFAAAALDWQQLHPDDPRTITVLGWAERAVRNGCRTKTTPELNHRLFVVVQTKYPKSEWAKKYTTWE